MNLLPPNWWLLDIEEVASLAPLQKVHWPLLSKFDVELVIKRDDLLHPNLAGNKFYKLLGHIQAFKRSGFPRWLTFGGAYSNHLYAFAAASQQLGIPSVAVIRGERPNQLSPTLRDVQAHGVQLKFISREQYRLKDQSDTLEALSEEFGPFYCVPEGGGGIDGAKGCAAWARQTLAMLSSPVDEVCVAAGTGCTSAGILSALQATRLRAFLAVKGSADENQQFASSIVAMEKALRQESVNVSQDSPTLLLESNYHCGGYARFPAYLREFLLTFETECHLPLDPVYTAKLFWGIADLARRGLLTPGSRLLVFHTGGLQGRRGFDGL